jgi:hypothetical protein
VSSDTPSLATGVMLMRCPNCGNELSGLQTDCIFLCTACGACWVAGEGFARVPIAYSGCSGEAFPMPFWKVEATVTVLRRISRPESGCSTLEGPRLFDGTERKLIETSLPPVRDTLVFPAFATGQALRAGVFLQAVDLTEDDPYEAGSIKPMVGGSVGQEDVRDLARGVVVGMHTARKDFLAMLELDLQMHSASILAIGCLTVCSHLKFAGGGLTIPVGAVTDHAAIQSRHSGPGPRVDDSREKVFLTGTVPASHVPPAKRYSGNIR